MKTKIEIEVAFFLRGEELSHFSLNGNSCHINVYKKNALHPGRSIIREISLFLP